MKSTRLDLAQLGHVERSGSAIVVESADLLSRSDLDVFDPVERKEDIRRSSRGGFADTEMAKAFAAEFNANALDG